jgi:hypothetical protein
MADGAVNMSNAAFTVVAIIAGAATNGRHSAISFAVFAVLSHARNNIK